MTYHSLVLAVNRGGKHALGGPLGLSNGCVSLGSQAFSSSTSGLVIRLPRRSVGSPIDALLAGEKEAHDASRIALDRDHSK